MKKPAKRAATPRPRWAGLAAFVLLPTVVGLMPGLARADSIKHPIAVFSGLDKITGRIITFEVESDETVQFGSLQITERACYTRPATETPQTTTFIEVDEVDASNDYKRIFSGWMFASSPGLHGVEHPIYDIWLMGCKGGSEESVATAPEVVAPEPSLPAAPAPAEPKPSRRHRQQPAEDLAAEPPPFDQDPVVVGPPPGAESEPSRRRRAPSQQYYPTEPVPQRDPFGDGF